MRNSKKFSPWGVDNILEVDELFDFDPVAEPAPGHIESSMPPRGKDGPRAPAPDLLDQPVELGSFSLPSFTPPPPPVWAFPGPRKVGFDFGVPHPPKAGDFLSYYAHHNLKHLHHRNMDGSDNNASYSEYGAAGTKLIRITEASYADGDGTPIAPRTNYRALSNDIIRQDGEMPNTFGVSDMFTFFGQFLDHDIDLALEGHEDGPYVMAPLNDIQGFAGRKLGIERSDPYPDGDYGHANAITSFVDASNVYGSDDQTLAQLRDADKPWLLAMNEDNGKLLPLSGGGPFAQFVAGDVRAGENSALTSLHTIWALEHNRQAEAMKAQFPYWTDEDVFQATKIKIEALMQHVVFDEWLPTLLGHNNIPEYQGYNPHIDPTISQEFAHAAFRFGHSMLSSQMQRLNEDGSSAGHLGLAQMFFNAAILKDAGSVDTLVRGIASHTAQEIDHKLVEDVRSLLFPAGGELQARDLSVLNLLRGIDHGLGSLNEVRDDLGMSTYASFMELTGDADLANALAAHYDHVNQVDLWIGGLIEAKVPGSQLGETFHHIVLDQFMRLRDGDAYYYEERLKDNPWLLDEIKSTKFSDIIKANTDVEYLQQDVFYAYQRHGGSQYHDDMVGTDGRDLIIGFAGHDTLNGGKDNDELYGGRGRDIFVFEEGTGHDRVGDFQKGKDKLDITELVWTSNGYNHFHISADKDGTTIEFASGDSIELVGVKGLGYRSLIINNDDHDYYGP